MADDLYPGAPLRTGSVTGFTTATLGVVVRDSVDCAFYGVTARQLARNGQVALTAGERRVPVGKLTGKFAEEFDERQTSKPISELLGFLEIQGPLTIADRNPNFEMRVVSTAPIQIALSSDLFVLRATGAPVSVTITGTGLTFDLIDDEDDEPQSFNGGLEVASVDPNQAHAAPGDGGAPVVTPDGRLVGVLVAIGDESSIVAPLDTFLKDAELQIFIREKHWATTAAGVAEAAAIEAAKRRANPVGGARIAGVNIPSNKRVVIALQYIHGIGPAKAKEVCNAVGIESHVRVFALRDEDVLNIREYVDRHFTVEGDLRRENAFNIKRLMDLACYRGLRHRKGLPVRGQRTHTNARTRKGPAKPIQVRK